MKFLNKYLITFLASGLIILPAFSAVATNVDLASGAGNASLINI